MSRSPETSRKILDAAFSCTETGTDFSMADVAGAAGLSRQAVYLHFPDRAGLLTALLARTLAERPLALAEDAPSARAALSALVARFAEIYPKVWPVVRAQESETGDRSIAPDCRALAERFRSEGALAAHLSPSAAADLLATLLSLAVWKELVIARGWDSARYKSHIAFLAAGTITR
jgi:AcrR family transcriptional regulator